jgi:periplasmic copper chaperone A
MRSITTVARPVKACQQPVSNRFAPEAPRHAQGLIRSLIGPAMIAAVFGLAAPAAFAHAMPRGASPGADSTLTQPPKEVTITFSEAVEPRFSTIEVTNAAGQRVDQGAAHLAAGDGKQLGVALVSLPAGAYTVTWHATSVDTHKTDGHYQFTVAAADPSALTIDHVWARASAGNATTGAAYLTVTDNGKPDRLVGVSTPVAAEAQVHESIDDNGVMKMRPVQGGVTLAPGTPVTFKPGGYHIMLMGLKAPLKAGDSFPLTLTFEQAQPLTVTARIEAAGAPMRQDHGGMPGMEHKP